MKNSEEIVRVCEDKGIKCRLLKKSESLPIIESALLKYKVSKVSGHLSIYHNSISIPLEENEFSYSSNLKEEPIYMFFDQSDHNREEVVEIIDGRTLGQIMEESYGMEYFLTNHKLSYLIAVNWYVIEGAGDIKDWMSQLT